MDLLAWHLLVFVLSALFILPFIRSAVVWVIVQVKWLRYWWYLRSLPSPPRHWLLGHVTRTGPGEKYIKEEIEWHEQFPDFYVMFYGPFFPLVTITSPEFKKILLKTAEPKFSAYFYMSDWIGDGLLLSSGEKWFRHRKMLTPAFHFDILKSYVPVMNEVTHTLLDMWQELADKGTTFNVFDYSSLYTLDILLRCAFSDSTSNCLMEKDSNPYVHAIHGITSIPASRIRFPPYHIKWIFDRSPLGKRFHNYIATLHDYTDRAISKRRKSLLEDSGSLSRKYIDFLDVLLSTKDQDDEGLTDVEIREEVNTFMFEGHDTTASGLCWTLYCLATNPDHQEKCRREAREVLSSSDDITWEDLNKLEYISMCIKESMRVYPPVPAIGRELSKDYEWNGYKLQRGTSVTIRVDGHHYNSKLWPNPMKFDPLRFTTENIKSQDSFAYTPFSAGPRNCIGQNFAMNELKIAVAHIVNRFSFEVDPSCTVERSLSLVLRAEHGILLKLYSV